jgi:hypothetical protein
LPYFMPLAALEPCSYALCALDTLDASKGTPTF